MRSFRVLSAGRFYKLVLQRFMRYCATNERTMGKLFYSPERFP